MRWAAPQPDVVAGHSLGEYTALVAAGALAFATALPLVRFRAQAMQEAVPVGTGAMAAILGLDDDAVRAACAEAAQGEVVEAVNFNAPEPDRDRGHKAAVERAMRSCQGEGRQARAAAAGQRAVPFVADEARGRAAAQGCLADVDFAAPQIPVINNVDVAIVTRARRDPRRARAAGVRRRCAGSRRSRRCARCGVTHVVECGPGKVLAGMTKRIEPEAQSFTLADRASLAERRRCA